MALLLESLFFCYIDHLDQKPQSSCDKSINTQTSGFKCFKGRFMYDALFTLPNMTLQLTEWYITFKALISTTLLDLCEVTIKIMDLHIKQIWFKSLFLPLTSHMILGKILSSLSLHFFIVLYYLSHKR